MKTSRILVLAVWVASLWSVTECQAADPPVAKAKTDAKFSTQDGVGGSWGGILAAKIKLEDGSGKVVLSIKPKDDGAKLVDGGERELARYHWNDDTLKIKDASDHVLGYVAGSRGAFQLKDPAQKSVLFAMSRLANGDWKLTDGKDVLIYTLKRRESGVDVEDGQGKGVGKCSVKRGKVVLRDGSDAVRYSVHSGVVSPLSASCLALERVGDLSLRTALMLRMALEDGGAASTPPGERKP